MPDVEVADGGSAVGDVASTASDAASRTSDAAELQRLRAQHERDQAEIMRLRAEVQRLTQLATPHDEAPKQVELEALKEPATGEPAVEEPCCHHRRECRAPDIEHEDTPAQVSPSSCEGAA